MSALKWNMDAKRKKRIVSVLDEQERRDRDAAAKWLERAETSKRKRTHEKVNARGRQ
jgi:hypothetical protein